MPVKTDDPRAALLAGLRARIAGKAKPVGALGRLEELAVQIGLATRSLAPELGTARLVVFAGDHGLTAEGVSAYSQAVTLEIAKLVLAGKAVPAVTGADLLAFRSPSGSSSPQLTPIQRICNCPPEVVP